MWAWLPMALERRVSDSCQASESSRVAPLLPTFMHRHYTQERIDKPAQGELVLLGLDLEERIVINLVKRLEETGGRRG